MICERCGSCCVQYDGNNFATEDDIKRWVYQVRCDILQYCYGFEEWCFWDVVSEDNNAHERVISHLIKNLNNVVWFDPDTGDQLYICPFLRKKYGKAQFECLIHDTRPWACRQFFCNPNGDTPSPIGTVHARIIKKSFEENLKEHRKKRKWECENRRRNRL